MATMFATRTNEVQDPKANVQHIGAADCQKLRDMETGTLVVTEAKLESRLQSIIFNEIRDNEVLVEMKLSGICAADQVPT